MLQTTVQRAVPIALGGLPASCPSGSAWSISASRACSSPAPSPARRRPASRQRGSGSSAAIAGRRPVRPRSSAALVIRYRVDQIIAGVAINIFVLGHDVLRLEPVLTDVPRSSTTPERFGPIPIPFLSDIPVVGPILFQQNVFVYGASSAIIAHPLHALLHALGPAGARRRRAPRGRRHARHRRLPGALHQRHPRRHGGRASAARGSRSARSAASTRT